MTDLGSADTEKTVCAELHACAHTMLAFTVLHSVAAAEGVQH